MRDKIFGNIKWRSDCWIGSFSVPYFAGCGEFIPDEDNELPANAARVDPKLIGRCDVELRIYTKGFRGRPSEEQRKAWRQICDRGDALWDEALDAILLEYSRERPRRVRYWKNKYGKLDLSRHLPVIQDRSELRRLVAPYAISVHAPTSADGTINIDLSMIATWGEIGICVGFGNGRVNEIFGSTSMLMRRLPSLKHPIFGMLRSESHRKGLLCGFAEIKAFQNFAAIAVDRASWDPSASETDSPTSDLDWVIARGSCCLYVYATLDSPPTKAQADEFMRFKASGKVIAVAVVKALFSQYKKTFERNRRLFRKGLQMRAIPRLTTSAVLAAITELHRVYIFPEEDDGSVPIVLNFRGTWTGKDGLCVRIRDGTVEEVGIKAALLPRVN